MILSDGTPITTRQKALIIPYLPIDIMRKHRDHVLICLVIEVMDLVALIEDVSHHLWWGGINNGR